MAQSDRKYVKLTSLRVVDFKTLQKQNISWDFQQTGDLDVIGVKDFYERTTLFQAIQFGFGHDTDAPKAEVIVTMQHGDASQSKKWLFKHVKKAIRDVTKMVYGIQIDGIDDAFREVDQKEFFDKFAELNVFASQQPFCFEGNMKNVLASSYIDLRPCLEMYLMKKEKQNDYDDLRDSVVPSKQEQLIEKRKALLKCNKKIDGLQQAYSQGKENRQCQAESERDSWLLQLFYYHKYSEVLRDELNMLRQQIGSEDGVQNNELDPQIRQWESDLRAKLGQAEVAKGRKSLLDEQRKAIQEQIDAYEAEGRVLSTTDFDAAKQFGKAYTQFKHENLDLIIKSEDDQFNLSVAELEAQVNEWNPNGKRAEKKPAGGLFGQQWNAPKSAMERALDEQKKQALEKLQRASSFDAGLYRFKDDAFDLNRYTNLPFTDGIITVESTAFNSKTIYAESDKQSLNNHVIVHSTTDGIPIDQNPFGRLISSEHSEPPNFDVIQSTLRLKCALNSIEENDFSELRDSMKRFKDTDYSGVLCQSADVGRAPTNQKIRDLTNKAKETEQELMTRFSAHFNSILPNLGLDSKPAIDCINRYQGAFATSKGTVQQQIDWITQKVTKLKSYKQRLDADKLNALYFNEQNMQDVFIAMGKQMIESYGKVVDNACAKSLIVLKEAFLNSTALAIDYINKIISKSEFDLSFAKEETSPKAYFDEVSARNAESIDPNAHIDEIFKAVAAQVNKSKEGIARKDDCILYDDPELSKLKKKNSHLNQIIKNQIVYDHRQLKMRVEAFQKEFERFVENFNTMAFECKSEWCPKPIQMRLDYDKPALMSNITMLVAAGGVITTVQHHAAALVLKLAINCTLGSPVLIIDGQDYVIESKLLTSIMVLLKKWATEYRMQIIFMVVNPQEELPATSTHHMWTNEMDVEEIVETTDLVLGGSNSNDEQTVQDESSATSVKASMQIE